MENQGEEVQVSVVKVSSEDVKGNEEVKDLNRGVSEVEEKRKSIPDPVLPV